MNGELLLPISGEWVRLRPAVAAAVTMYALARATQDAMRALGVEVEITDSATGIGHRLQIGVATANIEHSFDYEAEGAAVVVRLADGRQATGFAPFEHLAVH